MANLYITNTAQFNPFSYDEMLKPALLATQAHQELEDLYSEIGDEAAIVAGSINPITDKDTYARYKGFEDALRAEADTLASKGLNPSSRRTAQLLRSRYKKEITPIETAIKNRTEKAKEQRAGRMNDDTIMYDRDFSTISLDELIKNPDLGYTTVSGNTLYKQGMQAAAAASSRNVKTLKALGNQYWQIRQGYGSDAANKFLLDNSNIPELKDAVNRIASQSGVTDNNKARAIDYTINGIMAGLTYNEAYQANRGYISPAEAQRLAMERERLDFMKQSQGPRAIVDSSGNPTGTYLDPSLGMIVDGKGRIVGDQQGAISKIGTGRGKSGGGTKFDQQLELRQNMFQSLDYTGSAGGGIKDPSSYDRFSEDDAELISFNDLTPQARKRIITDLADYGLSVKDVDIYKDTDWWFLDDHYRVVRKGAGVSGGTTNPEASADEQTKAFE